VNTYFFIFSVCTFYAFRHISTPFVFFIFCFFSFVPLWLVFVTFLLFYWYFFKIFLYCWKYFNHTKILHLNSIHSSVYIGMRSHLYIFFTMFGVHSFFFVFFIMLIWCPTVVSQHLSKNDKRGWLTRWPPQSFANPIWHSAPLCLHWSTIVPLCFHLL